MEKDTELKELIERSDTGNKFSIYDYLRFQTVVLDDTLYAIVYQNGNQCFLEEAEITVQNNNAVSEKILTIYTNKQRIMTYDDIAIDVAEYDDIIRKQKADDSERSSQSE